MTNKVILFLFFLSWTLFIGHVISCLTPGWAETRARNKIDMNFGFLWYCNGDNVSTHCYETDSTLNLSGLALLLSSVGYLFGVIICSLNVTRKELDKSFLFRVILSYLGGGIMSLVALVSYAYLMESQVPELVAKQIERSTGVLPELSWSDMEKFTSFWYSFYMECTVTSLTYIGLVVLGIAYRHTHLEQQRESFYFSKL